MPVRVSPEEGAGLCEARKLDLGLRIGSVPYLNAKPLVYGLGENIAFEHPVQLAQSLRNGCLDVALVPVVECFLNPVYSILDGLCVASDGPVKSVIVMSRKPFGEIQKVALDRNSLTSSHLARLMLEAYVEKQMTFCDEKEDADAMLYIGDRALEMRKRQDSWNILDLGDVWKRCTGLPLVYAVWAVHPQAARKVEALREFRLRSKAGIRRIHEIARTQEELEYLTSHIRFELRDESKKGISEFRDRLTAKGLISPAALVCEYLNP